MKSKTWMILTLAALGVCMLGTFAMYASAHEVTAGGLTAEECLQVLFTVDHVLGQQIAENKALRANYTQLHVDHYDLNSLHNMTLASHAELQNNHTALLANHASIQSDYDSLLIDRTALLWERNSLALNYTMLEVAFADFQEDKHEELRILQRDIVTLSTYIDELTGRTPPT